MANEYEEKRLKIEKIDSLKEESREHKKNAIIHGISAAICLTMGILLQNGVFIKESAANEKWLSSYKLMVTILDSYFALHSIFKASDSISKKNITDDKIKALQK